jgi:hypothetical protein
MRLGWEQVATKANSASSKDPCDTAILREVTETGWSRPRAISDTFRGAPIGPIYSSGDGRALTG